MKVYLTSAYPYHEINNFAALWLNESAQNCPYQKHTTTTNPNEADVILFVEHHPPEDPYLFKVLRHPLTKKYREKVILHTDVDKPIAILPTISPSFEKSFYNSKLNASIPYIARHVSNNAINNGGLKNHRKYLFSFLGASRTHSVRNEILKLKFKESFLRDTSSKNLWQLTNTEKINYEKEFVKISKESYFVLCPRGVGVNSYRLYEAMEMGVVPVIISDNWIPSYGPDWESFSIRVKESDVDKIPELLLKRKPDALNMGLLARKNWEEWFAKEVVFHHIVNSCFELLKINRGNKIRNFYYSYYQFLRPYHFKNLMRYFKINYLNKIINK